MARKKMPPAPERTDIYNKLGGVLKLPPGKLAAWADLQRRQELKRKILSPPVPLLREVRDLLLAKCKPQRRAQIRAIFEKEPFGELERLITQKLLDVVQSVAGEELGRENWLRAVAKQSGRSYKQMRVAVLEFLDSDVFNITSESCIAFLEPLIISWDIDLRSFSLEITLNSKVASANMKKVEFLEKQPPEELAEEPGLREFLKDRSLSADATPEEIDFLKGLRFNGDRHPTAMYYYRELQNLRDPLHFRRKQLLRNKSPKRLLIQAFLVQAIAHEEQISLDGQTYHPRCYSKHFGPTPNASSRKT